VTIDSESDISALLERPEFFPSGIDLERQGVDFVQMSRETFRRSSFLDDRTILAGPATRFVELEELQERLSSRSTGCPTHFILHGAFCGSTLLARHFEELPHCLVLKEPHLLAQIAKLGNAAAPGGMESRAWAVWFEAALSLLARTDADDLAVVIKAADQCNWLANRLLDRDRETKIIFLCAPLRVFLLSVVKSQGRRRWVRGRGRGLRSQLSRVPFRDPLVADDLTDAQLGAALWLLNSFLCSELLAGPESDRILAMSSEDVIGRPRETFHQAVEFFGLTRDADIRSTLGAFSPIQYYSKSPDLPGHFDAAMRDACLAEIDKQVGQEVDAAIVWAARMSADWLSKCPFPLE
jgi:hypothetical protein